MLQSPITDNSIGLKTTEKFRNVRNKAKQDEIIRKTKRNKQEKLPRFKIDQQIILTNNISKNKDYHLMEVIDISPYHNTYIYYGILLKTTNKNNLNRIGNLIHFIDDNWHWIGYTYANIQDIGIKWIT